MYEAKGQGQCKSAQGSIYGVAARADFAAAVAAMFGVLIFDTLSGLIIGIAVSMLLHAPWSLDLVLGGRVRPAHREIAQRVVGQLAVHRGADRPRRVVARRVHAAVERQGARGRQGRAATA